ncbi:MAG: hypothetical protein RLZ83_1389, partial [Pseudomonadota bacterium]
MQISDLVQLQGAARTVPSAQAPTADAGRPPPSSGAEPAAGEGFGSQLRRAIERQASAAAEDTAAGRRPESAGKADELDGLEALDASLSDVDPGTPEGVLVGGLQAQSTAGDPVMAEGPEVSQVTGGGQRVRMSPPVASQVPAASVEPMPSTTDVLRAAAVRTAPSVAPGPVAGSSSTAAGLAMPDDPEVSQVTGGGQRVRMSPPVASQVPAGSVEPMPSTTDVLRAAAVRTAPSVAPGPVGGNFSTAAGEAEGLLASAQSPAIARRPAKLESRLITEPPVRVPASDAGRVGAPMEAEVGVAKARVQATPV